MLFYALQLPLAAWQATGTLVAAVGAGVLLLKTLEHRSANDLGFALNRKAPLQVGVGYVLGVGGLALACLLMVVVGSLRYVREGGTAAGWASSTMAALWVFAIPAAAEEALFRGYAFQKLVEAIGGVAATILASCAFAFAHRNNPGVDGIAFFNIAAAGAMLAVAYLRTGSLWFTTGLHMAWNWTMAALFDLPVSGLRLFDTPLYDAVDRGPRWVTGGSFGPEAGFAGLIGIALITTGVIVTTRKREWLT